MRIWIEPVKSSTIIVVMMTTSLILHSWIRGPTRVLILGPRLGAKEPNALIHCDFTFMDPESMNVKSKCIRAFGSLACIMLASGLGGSQTFRVGTLAPRCVDINEERRKRILCVRSGRFDGLLFAVERQICGYRNCGR